MRRSLTGTITVILVCAAFLGASFAQDEPETQSRSSYAIVTKTPLGGEQRTAVNPGERIVDVLKNGKSVGIHRMSSDTSRVIIELRDAPLAQASGEYSLAAVEDARQQRLFTLRRVGDEIAALENDSRARRGLATLDRSSVVSREYSLVFNGLAATLSHESIESVTRLPEVKRVWPDGVVKALVDKSIPKIRADQVWSNLGATGKDVVVAIIDTGIDYTHKDLGGCRGAECRVLGGYDFVNNDTNPTDDNGHGTHVAGIVAANGLIKGVAPDAKLVGVKVLDASGQGYWSDIIAGVEWSVRPELNGLPTEDQPRILNLSLGGSGTPDDPVSQAVDNAVELGVMVVVAAGNDGPDFDTLGSPGVARSVLTVGASDDNDGIAAFSSRGPSLIYQMKPEILAPGVAIRSTVPRGSCELCDISGYADLDGTSMATPHVAGAAALLLERYPTWDPAQLKAALMQTAVDLNLNPFVQGAGRLDVYAAATFPTLASTGVINYGLDDLTGPTYGGSEVLTLTNTGTAAQTCTLTIDSSLPTGITASLSTNTLNIPAGESRTVTFSFNISNSVAPHSSQEPFDYSGAIVLQSAGLTAHVPFVVVKSPVLYANFGAAQSPSDQGLVILVHNQTYAKIFWVYGETVTVSVPPGTFNVVTLFGDACSYVVREGLAMTQRTEIQEARTDATHQMRIQPVYHTGLTFTVPGDPATISSFRSKDGMVEFRVLSIVDRKEWQFSNVSSSYVFEATYFRNGFPHSQPSFIFHAYAANGISAPVTFRNSRSDFKHVQFRHGVDATFTTVIARNGLYYRDGEGIEQSRLWEEIEWDLNPSAKAPMTEDYYLIPEPYAGYEVGYIKEAIFKGNFTPNGLVYTTPYLRAAAQPLRLNGFLAEDFATPALSTTADFLPFGTSPFSWFGKFNNQPASLRLSAAVGDWPWLFLGQCRETRKHTNYSWELWQGTKKVKTGTLAGEPTAPVAWAISVTPGAYTFKTSSRFVSATAVGEGKVSAAFNTTAADPDPPYLTSFQILDAQRVSPTVSPGGGSVLFKAADNVGIAQVALSYDVGAGWQAATVQNLGGGLYTATIPAPPSSVNLKLEVTDLAGNSLIYETSADRMLMDLQLGIAHTGDFKINTKPSFDVKVTNVGTEPAVKSLQVVSSLPAGLKYDGFSGTGWSCANEGQTVTCEHPDPVQIGAYSTVKVKTVVTQTSAQYAFTSALGYTGDMNAANNTLTDFVVVESWTTPLLAAEDLYALAVHPTNPDILYAGTNRGVFRTTDRGATWVIFNPGADLHVRAIVIDPHDPQIIYVGASGEGVYKTTDGGGAWSAVNTGLTSLAVNGLAMGPVNSQILFAAAGNFLFQTSNSGQQWTAVPTGLTSKAHTAIAIDPTNSSRLYVGTAAGVRKSTDGGVSWVASLTHESVTRVNCIVFDRLNTQIVYAGTNGGFFRTTDAGATWSILNQGLNRTDVMCIEADPNQPEVIYLGTSNGGVYRSVDSGLTWSSFGLGRTTAGVFDILINEAIFAATNQGFIGLTLRPDLAISLEHAGAFLSGGVGRYLIKVTNAGLAKAEGTTTVVDTLPDGLDYLSASGAGWSCSANGKSVNCSRTQAIPTSASSDIALQVAIADASPTNCTNSATVDNASDNNASNDTATDAAVVVTSVPLWFPFLQGNATSYTGFAVSNTSTAPATLSFLAYGPDGSLLPFADNPADISLAEGQQKALLGGEIFSVNGDHAGWVKLLSDNRVAGLFLFGGDSQMDGSVAFSEQATKFYFTRVFEGANAFRGKAATTYLSLVNPNSAPIALTLRLYGDHANQLATTTRNLPAHGYYYGSLSNLFGQALSVSSGFVQVECTQGPGAIGFELVQLANYKTLIGLNATVPGTATRLYSAQLAQAPGLFTSIKLINTGAVGRMVDLTAVLIDNVGNPFTQVVSRSLAPGEIVEQDASTLFGWPANSANVGSLKVESNGAGIVGDVVFGDTGFAYNAALLLQSATFKKAVFSQVANGLGLFTGIALYNPGELPATATIEVYSNEGESTGEATIVLTPGNRTAQLLVELVPSTTDQITGYVIIRSDVPLIAQQLFGDGKFLAAVPPTVLE